MQLKIVLEFFLIMGLKSLIFSFKINFFFFFKYFQDKAKNLNFGKKF